MMNKERFLEKGYEVLTAENPGKLVELRQQIAQKARELVGDDEQDIDKFFNTFHHHELQGTTLNSLRVDLVKYCTENLDVGRTLFDAFSGTLTELLGPDLLVQKGTNLVIQQPGDPDVLPTHRDAPPHSPFEIVVWLPLVDVYGTKSMYVLDRYDSQVALEMVKDPDTGFKDFSRKAQEEGEIATMPFGQALFFWPGLVHSVDINTEHETRWALNIRYKNLFSPMGNKGQVEFFEVLNLSPLARMALQYEKEANS